MATPSEVQAKLQAGISDAAVEVEDLTGQSNHYSVRVVSKAFEGKSLIEQHQMIYKALGEEIKEEIHALSIQTSIP